jgi:hypothetical protein
MRLQRRRRLLLWSVVPVLLALLLAAKLLSAAWFSGQAGSSFARGDAAAVEQAAGVMGLGNFMEAHKAPFAAGDARALRGDYAAARTAFEAALAAAPPADQCRVRANLALSIERLADAAPSAAMKAPGPTDVADTPDTALAGGGAAELLAEALAVVEAAPEGCFNPDGADPEAAERLQAAGPRLANKIEHLGNQPPAEPGADPADDEDSSAAADPLQPQLEQLEEAGKSAQQERNRGLEREEYLDGSGTGPLTDRPW